MFTLLGIIKLYYFLVIKYTYKSTYKVDVQVWLLPVETEYNNIFYGNAMILLKPQAFGHPLL